MHTVFGILRRWDNCHLFLILQIHVGNMTCDLSPVALTPNTFQGNFVREFKHQVWDHEIYKNKDELKCQFLHLFSYGATNQFFKLEDDNTIVLRILSDIVTSIWGTQLSQIQGLLRKLTCIWNSDVAFEDSWAMNSLLRANLMTSLQGLLGNHENILCCTGQRCDRQYFGHNAYLKCVLCRFPNLSPISRQTFVPCFAESRGPKTLVSFDAKYQTWASSFRGWS